MNSSSQSTKLNVRRHKISGGIKPPSCKATSLRSRIMPMPLPPRLILPLEQYGGASAIPLVNVGDHVLKYQLIAQAGSFGSAPVHAPSSGVVSHIGSAPVAGHPGKSSTCIQIECDGLDDALDLHPNDNYQALTPTELLEKIETAGICGMGGAGFPAADKIRLAREHGTELLIINAAECEPYITTDEALLRERAAAVVIGAEILRATCQAPHGVIAIEKDKTDAIKSLKDALSHSTLQLLLIDAIYPTGGEKQLIQAVTGLEVPTDKYALDLGILVHNVGTVYAIFQAVIEGKPNISRVTTLTGAALQTPKNFDALLGTSVAFLFEVCGIDKTTHRTTLLGGSMMGVELAHIDVPITKSSNCLIAATAAELPAPEPELACIRCGFCADVCPSRLLPQLLYSQARAHRHSDLTKQGLADCIECGACAYVCPSNIPLVQYYVAAKQEIRTFADRQEQGKQWQSRFQYHQYRIKKEKETPQPRRVRIAKTSSELETIQTSFSRDEARLEIANAVARAKAKKSELGPVVIPKTPLDQEDEN